MIEFDVKGIPAPQGSKNAYRRGNRIVLVESSKKVPAWREAVALEAKKHCIQQIDGPVFISMIFRLPRPKSLPKKVIHMVKKPDLDKLIRSTCDALSGVAYVDDNRVACITAAKTYAGSDEEPGCEISIEAI